MMLLLLACRPADIADPAAEGGADSEVEDDLSSAAYDPDHLIEIEVEIDAESWDELRQQDRNLLDLLTGDCLAAPFESPYTWFISTVTIDGERLEEVSIRKKGLVGSQSTTRPSLKLDFDKSIDDQRWSGLSRLTLNNGRQDPSRLKTCMGYSIFADAGMPASRCSLAHVVVNGEDLGVYANVEPIKAPLLEQHFVDSTGLLYEGALSDFRPDWQGSFQDKTDSGDFTPIEAVTAALESGDDDALEAWVDLDRFYQYWAMEVLLGHWDSYSGNTNNFWVYLDPADDRLVFLPWGIDAILTGDEPFGAGESTAVVANSALTAHLYAVDPARYVDALEALVESVWQEEVLLERLAAWDALVADAVWPGGDDEGRYRSTIGAMEDFISGRRAQLEAELADGPPAWTGELGDPPCLVDYGGVTVDFETTWGSYGTAPTFSTGSGAWTVDISGESLPVTFLSAVAGETSEGALLFLAGQLESGENVGVYASFDVDLAADGAALAVDWDEVTAYLLDDSDGDYADWSTWAYLGDGTLTLDAGTPTAGAPFSGQWSSRIYTGAE